MERRTRNRQLDDVQSAAHLSTNRSAGIISPFASASPFGMVLMKLMCIWTDAFSLKRLSFDLSQFCGLKVPSGMRLEFGGAISGNMRLSFQAARSIG